MDMSTWVAMLVKSSVARTVVPFGNASVAKPGSTVLACEHDPWLVAQFEYVVPAGTTSVATTLLAGTAPTGLLTVNV